MYSCGAYVLVEDIDNNQVSKWEFKLRTSARNKITWTENDKRKWLLCSGGKGQGMYLGRCWDPNDEKEPVI